MNSKDTERSMDKTHDATAPDKGGRSKWSGKSSKPGFDRWLAQLEIDREPIGELTDMLHRLMLETGARKKELADALWAEFDLGQGVWSVPGGGKNRPARRVELTSAALKILRSLEGTAAATGTQIFAALGKSLYEDAAFLQSMARLRLPYRNATELRNDAVRRMKRRLAKLGKMDAASSNGISAG